ncbi:hypothetical protein BW716_01225 [[Flexibacter] sp. ATCC 35208]|nr:hypothetical protein BW716_01225 [[Flexibacter] sp. ATCC 35208]
MAASTMPLALMAAGSTMEVTETAGFQMPDLISNPTLPMVTGYTLTMVGPGCLITIGDGHLSTTVAGHMTTIMVGSGSQATNGDQHG